MGLNLRSLGFGISIYWDFDWEASHGALENEDYSFIATTPRFTLTWSSSTC